MKRIAYAPSFGLDIWDYSESETRNCLELLKKFNLVTVREESAVKLCEMHFGVVPIHVLDPTMLLEQMDYKHLVTKAQVIKSKGNMLVYLMDNSKQKYAFVYAFSQVDNIDIPVEQRVQISIEQWLQGFVDAEFVITDSFYACAFSIIFNIPFVVLSHKDGRMAIIYSLLKMFNLQDRLISNMDDIKELSDINWVQVNRLRQSMKEKALYFLDKAFS